MSSLKTILSLITLLGPYLDQLLPLIKQIIEVIKQQKDKPLVGAAGDAPTTQEVDNGIGALKNAGMDEVEARELLLN